MRVRLLLLVFASLVCSPLRGDESTSGGNDWDIPRAPSVQSADAPTKPAIATLEAENLRAMEALAARRPSDAKVRIELGNMYMDAKRWDAAIRWYGEALTLAPDNPDVRTDLGACYVHSGAPALGLEQFDAVLKKYPGHRNAQFNRGVALLNMGLQTDAADAWEDLLKCHPDDPQRAHLRGRIDGIRGAVNAARRETADSPTATEILARMADAYGRARTYRDTGSVRTEFIRDDGRRHATERPFKTAFARPDWFRFEFSSGSPSEERGRYIVWARGHDVRTWWGLDPGVKTAPSLGYALGAAAGVSGCASMTIPTLLLPNATPGADQAGAKLIVYADPVRLADEALGGVACFRLQTKRNGGDLATLWIDTASYLIRRIDSSHRFEDFRTEDTTVYAPVVDATVGEALLAFSAPENPPPATASAVPSGTPANPKETPPPQAASTAVSDAALGTDEHDAAIRHLIDIMGIGFNGGKVIDQLFETYKRSLPAIPPAVWDEVRTQLATEDMATLQVAIYRKHFSLQEIRGLLTFFQSPVGQRYIQEMPGLMRDAIAVGQEFSRKAKERLDRCLQQKGYGVS